MFKKIFLSSIAASLLLSIPVIADHNKHHDRHCDEVKEKIAEQKAHDKSTGGHIASGLLQFANKTAPLWSFLIAVGIACYAPTPEILSGLDTKLAKVVIGGGSFMIIYPSMKWGTAAGMSQTDTKPLSK